MGFLQLFARPKLVGHAYHSMPRGRAFVCPFSGRRYRVTHSIALHVHNGRQVYGIYGRPLND